MKTTNVLSLVLMLVLLAGCGGGSESSAPVSQNEASAQTESVDQATATAPVVPVSNQNETSTGTNSAPDQNETAAETGSILNEDYPDALPIRNQLTMGTLRLEENPGLAVTPEQAAQILPYWQALNSVLKSGSGAQSEIDALETDIQNGMTPEQLQAIAAMKLSQPDMQAEAKALGVNVSSMQSMMGQNLTDDERATRRAQRVASGQQGAGVLLMEKLIELLAERAN